MPTDHTRSAILSAAERLYADRGFADVTLRDIVAAADVNLAAVNYHFGSKDELIAELFVTRSLATNRERLNELKAAEAAGGGRADVDAILRALVGPTVRGCLGPNNERSTAARFMIRASIESVPPIRRIKNGDAALAARSQRGRSVLGPALRAGDGAPDHPRQRAAVEMVGRLLRPQRRPGYHRPRRRGIGDGAGGRREKDTGETRCTRSAMKRLPSSSRP
jgi:AcrR family transcriptional regulator